MSYRNKLSVMIICLNEPIWIEYCIKGIYDYVDEIIIVEGIAKIFKDMGVNFDNETAQNIRNYNDHKNKIKFFDKMVFEDKVQQREFALEQCSGDWVLLVDADEFYSERDILNLRNIIEIANQECRMIIYPHINFYDFGLYIDKMYMERLFKYDKNNMGYWGKPEDGQNIYDNKIGKLWGIVDFKRGNQKEFIFLKNVNCYHYSKIKSKKYIIDRIKYYEIRQNRLINDKELKNRVDEWFNTSIVQQSRLLLWNYNNHPNIIKTHYLYKKYVELYNNGKHGEFMSYLMNIGG